MTIQPDVWLDRFEPMVGDLAAVESFCKAKPSRFSVEALGTSSATIQVVENGLLHIAWCSFSVSRPYWEDSVMDFQGCSLWEMMLPVDMRFTFELNTLYYLQTCEKQASHLGYWNTAEWQEYWCERWPSPQVLEASTSNDFWIGASLIIFLSLSTFCIDFWNISAVSAKV